jgi:hypothetical protein
MTSTIKADVVTAAATNGNVTLQGNGSGTVAIADNTAITGTATVSSTLGVTGTTTLSGQAYPTDGGLWSGRNMVINGAMNVSQRGTSFTSVAASAFHLDRFQYNLNGTVGAATVTQQADGPNGFKNSLKIDVTTADASLAAADRLTLCYKFEGQDLQRVKKGTADAEKLILSFWVKATKTGTQIVELFDHDNTRHCAQSYTVSSGDTWEYKTVEYPADTTGALDDDNANSISIFFGLACGTDYTSGTLATTWAANTNANRFVGQVNNFDSTSNNFQITGVQLECGDAATPFEHESIGQTLQKCQRYYETSYPVGVTVPTNAQGQGPVVMFAGTETMAGSASIRYSGGRFAVAKRAAPSVAIYSYTSSTSGAISSASTADLAASSGVAIWIGAGGYNMQTNATGTLTPANGGFMWHFAADAEL